MEKERNVQTIVILALAAVIVTMSIGFAAFEANLNINGNVTVEKAEWNVAFDTNSYVESENSVTVASTDRSLTGTAMTYAVTLSAPGDFYEFTINVNNTGTFDAKLSSLTMTALTQEQAKYLTYTVSYNGTSYTTSNSTLAVQLAKKTGVAPVKVRVEYIQPADAADLPTEDVTVSLSAALHYDQVA